MLNIGDKSKKIIFGALIGGIMGGLSIYYSSRKNGKKSSSKTGNSMMHTLEGCKKEVDSVIHEVEKKMKDNESVVTDFFELASVGINLWKKIKNGR